MCAKHKRCDHANNEDTIQLPHNSIDEDIQKELDLAKDKCNAFIEQWFEVMSVARA